MSGRPQRPSNAFTLWVTSNRSKIKEKNPNISYNDFYKTAGEMWRQLDPEDKKVILDNYQEHDFLSRIPHSPANLRKPRNSYFFIQNLKNGDIGQVMER